MRAKEFTPPSKPRNFVAKNARATTSGAGAHQDKKKAEKQGYEKHKKKVDETELRDKNDLQAKRKALQDLQMDPNSSDPEIKHAIMQRKADLEKEAKAKGFAEGAVSEDTIRPKLIAALKQIGFKGPFKLGQLANWKEAFQDSEFDDETHIMIGGDDPEYDPWVAKGYGYGYAYGMESGYQDGLSAQQVLNQAKEDVMEEGSSPDYEMRRKGKTPEALGGSDAWYHRGIIPDYYGFEKGTPEFAAYIKGFQDWDEGPSGGKQWESTEMEGRHGYDDAGFSLAPGHDEGEPVYNPRYDRTGSYDRKAKYSQDYDYNTGKPLGAPKERKGFIFYNVNDPQTAQSLGLKQTKSGKWYLPTGSVFSQKTADKVFGPGKIWYPKD